MKGPGLRANLDVRRIWRCPRCGRVARTPGAVTAVRCGCAEDTWLQLQPPVKREPFRPPPRTPEQIAEDRADDSNDDEPIPQDQTPTEATKADPVAAAVPDSTPPATTTSEPIAPSPTMSDESRQDPPRTDSSPEADSFGEGIPSAE